MINNYEPETPPSPPHLPPPPPWSSEKARCELARSSVLGIFIMIIVTIIKHGDYFKHCFIRMYVSLYCYQAVQRSIHQEKGEEAALALRPESGQGGE